MTTEMWRPLSARDSGDAGLAEGIPEYLERPLRQWIDEHAASKPWAVKRIMVRLSFRWKPNYEDFAEGYGEDEAAHDHLAYKTEPDQLLDIADALLSLLLPTFSELPDGAVEQWASPEVLEARSWRIKLDQLLADAQSVYEVKPDGSGLQRRVPEYSARALEDAAAAADARPDAGSAAAQLRLASDAARALKPDASRAYSLAIKAVESAAHAVAEPNNHRATLGTMIGAMKANPGAFELAIPGPDGSGNVAPVIAMMSLLWQGQSSRHGGQTPTRDETPEETMMAVELAIALVGWFVAGRVRRRPLPASGRPAGRGVINEYHRAA